MDKSYTFTAYLFLVTCIATTCTVGSQGTTSWETDIDADGYRIHIYGTMEGSEKVKIINVNVTILAETSIANLCSSTKCSKNQAVPLQPELKNITSDDKCSMKYVCPQNCHMSKAFYSATYNVNLHCPPPQNHRSYHKAQINLTLRFKDGNQLNRTCIGQGELPYCTTHKTMKNGNDIIRIACKAKSKKCTPPTTTITTPMTVLVGGVVGGLFGGVVITVVIVFLCRACRSRRRHTEDEDGAGTKESHTYLGLIHTTSGKSPPGTNAVTSQVPDLIKVSAVQQASSAPSDVYDVIKEGDDNKLGVDPSACDQGDYVDIMDDMTGVGVYSMAQAAPGMAAQGGTPQPAAEYFVLEKDDPTDGHYNKLVRDGATETGTDVQGTYNRLVRDGAPETGTDVQGTYNRLVRGGATETGTDMQGTYNRLVNDGATETGTDVQGTYNKLGSMADDNDDNEPPRNNGTAADYFVVEKPEDTPNKLAQAAPGMAVQDDTPPSAAEYFVLEKDGPTDGDYNRLVRDGATETTTDVQDTYNKLGSMADDNDDNEPPRNNGTAADYFVVEKPEDTPNKLAQAAPGMAVQDDTPPSAAEYFVLEKDGPTNGDYNRLVRDGATETTTDVQDTYNKLGSMADDKEDIAIRHKSVKHILLKKSKVLGR